MTPKDIRNMVSMIRAIRAGKWTDELPAWAVNLPKLHFDICPECETAGSQPVVLRHSADATCNVCGADWPAPEDEEVLQESEYLPSAELRAVQTAEAFILLAHSSGTPFNETTFLQDCGFVPK